MCDNPPGKPWEVSVDREMVLRVFPEMLDMVLERKMEKDIRALRSIPRERLLKMRDEIRRAQTPSMQAQEKNLSHVEFDISKIKSLPEAELRELLGNRLVPRIIDDIKKLDKERPIPDWCYAFF